MKSRYWYYKGSDIIGAGEEEKKERDKSRAQWRDKRRIRAEEERKKERG